MDTKTGEIMITLIPLDNQNKDFSSAWSCLTDKNNIPIKGDVIFSQNGILCCAKNPSFRLQLLFEVRGFGEVMLTTRLLHRREKQEILESSLITGRLEQIQMIGSPTDVSIANTIAELGIIACRQKNITETHKMLAKLLMLGEHITLRQAKKIVTQKLHRGELSIQLGGQAFSLLHNKNQLGRFKKLFDFGVIPTYMFLTEPSQNNIHIHEQKKLIKLLKCNEITAKGSPLIWFHPNAIPDWIKVLPFAKLCDAVRNHVHAVVSAIGKDVFLLDICNEFAAQDANGLTLNIDQLLILTKIVSEEVHKVNPSIKRILNFSEIFGVGSSISIVPSIPMEHFLDLCIQNDIEFDGIGFQCYFGLKKEFTCREMLNISQFFDRFSRFNKELHITEIGVPSKFAVDPTCFFPFDHPASGGWWHKPWNEQVQADFVDKLVLLFLSKPNATSITWWDFTDEGTSKDISTKFFPFAGLIRRDGSPKPVLRVLARWRKLINNSKKGEVCQS